MDKVVEQAKTGKQIFQGFDAKELLILFTFLLIYEKHLSGYKKDKYMYKAYPFLENDFSTFNMGIINKPQKQDELTYNMVELSKHFYHTTENNKKNHSVLRHIRNAIAHGLLEKSENHIQIRDYHKKKPSAIGRIKSSKVMNLINSIVKNIPL